MLNETIERIAKEHNIRKSPRSDGNPIIKTYGELSYMEYCIVFKYSLDHDLDSIFDGIRQLIREEGVRQLNAEQDN